MSVNREIADMYAAQMWTAHVAATGGRRAFGQITAVTDEGFTVTNAFSPTVTFRHDEVVEIFPYDGGK
jgi:hypothetical protein